MKNISHILIILCAGVLLSGCGVYKSYQRPEVETSGLYRDTVSNADTLKSGTINMGDLPWQEVFRDPKLQALIRQGLDHNVDLQTALLRVKEAQAALMSARLSYTPTLGLSPQGTISSFDKQKAVQTYQLPAVASWELDLFGKLLNSKRKAKADLLQSDAYRQAVQTQIIAGIANTYYSLLMLDRQLSISEKTAKIWGESVETMRAMKEAGMTNEAAIVQSEANYYAVNASVWDLRRQVREVENSLSTLLGMTPQAIDRGTIEEQSLPTELAAGVPVQLLANRPDVKASEMALAGAFYNTNAARAAFYPQITINGTVGWTNSAGSMIVNPGKLIASTVGSLTQPIFARGANRARLQIAKAQQEEALLSFQQSLLNAGAEVSDALYQFHSANEKSTLREDQIKALENSVDYTQELMRLGTSTYLEVLTAQQSLLSAQLSQVSDNFESLQAVVNLYQALGGGREDKPLN